MGTLYSWHEAYKAALLEIDWTKIPERIQAAESEIRERQRVISEDHGGTAEEREAIANALRGVQVLQNRIVGE